MNRGQLTARRALRLLWAHQSQRKDFHSALGRQIATVLSLRAKDETWTYNVMSWKTVGSFAGLALSFAAIQEAQSDAVSNKGSQDEAPQVPDAVSNQSTAKWKVFTQTALAMWNKGDKEGALKFMTHALEEARLGFGERDPHTGAALLNLAEVYRNRREIDKAEPLYQEALDLLREAYGELDHRYAHTLQSAAMLYELKGEIEKARSSYRQALQAVKASKGREHSMYAKYLSEFGLFELRQGRTSESRSLYEEAIAIYSALGPSHLEDAINAEFWLVQSYLHSPDRDEPETMKAFRRFIERTESAPKVSKGLANKKASLMGKLADILVDEDRKPEALELYRQSLANQTGQRADHLAVNFIQIAKLELEVHKNDKAALIRANNLANQAVNAWAGLYNYIQERKQEETDVLQKVYIWAKQIFNSTPSQPESLPVTACQIYIEALSLLAKTEKELGRPEEAKKLLRRCIQILNGVALKSDHLHTLATPDKSKSKQHGGLSGEQIMHCQLIIPPLYSYLELNGPDSYSLAVLERLDATMDFALKPPESDIQELVPLQRLEKYMIALNKMSAAIQSTQNKDTVPVKM